MPSYRVIKDLVKDGMQCLAGSTVEFEQEINWLGYLEPIDHSKKVAKSNKKAKTSSVTEQPSKDELIEEPTN